MALYLSLDEDLPDDWKYNGYSLRDIMEKDPEYIEWLLSNDKIIIDEEAQDYWDSIKHGGY